MRQHSLPCLSSTQTSHGKHAARQETRVSLSEMGLPSMHGWAHMCLVRTEMCRCRTRIASRVVFGYRGEPRGVAAPCGAACAQERFGTLYLANGWAKWPENRCIDESLPGHCRRSSGHPDHRTRRASERLYPTWTRAHATTRQTHARHGCPRPTRGGWWANPDARCPVPPHYPLRHTATSHQAWYR
jgi:hypothetical protein